MVWRTELLPDSRFQFPPPVAVQVLRSTGVASAAPEPVKSAVTVSKNFFGIVIRFVTLKREKGEYRTRKIN